MPPLDPELDPHFEEAARLNNLDPMLLRALASGESGGNAIATSPKGAGGLMQIMPETAKAYGIADPYDPVQAIYGGAKILNDNLTKAEAAKAAGANVDPTDEALRSYFAGPGGGNRGPETAAYPGYIAQKYLALQNGQEPPAPPPVSGIGALAAAKATPMPAPGAVATNATPPANAPDTFEPAPDRVAALAALSGQGTAPTPQVRLASALEPGLTDQEADARRAAGAQAENAMLLDPNLNPSAAGERVPAGAPQQMAQAAPDPEIADLLAANRKMFGGQPPGAAQPMAQPMGAASPVEAPMPSGTTTSARMAEIKWAQDFVSHRTQVGRPVPGWVDELSKMEPGMPLSPEYQQAAAASAKLGGNLQRINPTTGMVEPIPGAPEAAAATAGAVKGAEAQAAFPTQSKLEGISQAVRGEEARKTAQFTAELNANPNAFNFTPGAPLPKGPGTTDPISMPASEMHPMPSTLPPLALAAPMTGGKTYFEDKQKEAAKEESIWNSQRADNEVAIQRLSAMMDAMKQVQTGAYTTNLAHFKASLNAGGIHIADDMLPNAAEVQKILKNNFQAAIGTMKQTGNSRWTQRELQGAQDSMANPDLQPEANLSIGAQVIGTLKWENSKIDDWAPAKRFGWRDPTDFERAWVGMNPLQPVIDQTKHDIGPLKGMAQPGEGQQNPSMPQPPMPGATMGTDGKWHIMINGQSHTLQPPPGAR